MHSRLSAAALGFALVACASGGEVEDPLRASTEHEVVPHAGAGGAAESSGNGEGGVPVDPACDDGVRNGDEEDVDCGGSCAPCCQPESYEASSGLGSGSVSVCCGDGDALVDVIDCGVGDNHGVKIEGGCGVGFEGEMNNGASCVTVVCETGCGAAESSSASSGSSGSSSSGGSSSASSGSGGGDTCTHDKCQDGDALDAGCDGCVASVCAADAYCCDALRGAWDGACVGLVTDVCGQSCP